MKNKLPVLALFLALTALLTSCIELTEEITLRKNGSGTYSATIKMGNEILDVIMEALVKEAGSKDSLATIEMLGDLNAIREDTTIVLHTLVQSSMTATTADLLKRASISTFKDGESTSLFSRITFEFNHPDEIAQLGQQIALLFQDTAFMVPDGVRHLRSLYQFAVPAALPEFVWDRKMLTRLPVKRDIWQKILEKRTSGEDPQKAAQLEYLMRNAMTFKTLYHFPGKIKETTFPRSFMEGKTLEVRYDSKIFDSGQSGIIRYK